MNVVMSDHNFEKSREWQVPSRFEVSEITIEGQTTQDVIFKLHGKSTQNSRVRKRNKVLLDSGNSLTEVIDPEQRKVSLKLVSPFQLSRSDLLHGRCTIEPYTHNLQGSRFIS